MYPPIFENGDWSFSAEQEKWLFVFTTSFKSYGKTKVFILLQYSAFLSIYYQKFELYPKYICIFNLQYYCLNGFWQYENGIGLHRCDLKQAYKSVNCT